MSPLKHNITKILKLILKTGLFFAVTFIIYSGWMPFNAHSTFSPKQAQAAIIFAKTSGSWSATTTWAGGVLPNSTDTVTIAGSNTVTVDAGCTGTVCVANTLTLATSTAGSLTFASGSILTVSATTTVGNGSTAIGTVTMTSGGTLNTGVLVGSGTTADAIFNPGTGTVNITLSSTLPANTHFATFNALIVGGGTLVLGQAITATTTTISNGATLDVGGSNLAIAQKGNWSNSGTFNAQAGTVTFSGTSAQTIGGTAVTSFYKLTITNAAGVTQGAGMIVTNALSITTGTFFMSSYNATTTTLSITGTAFTGGTGTLVLNGPNASTLITNTATFNAPTSTIISLANGASDTINTAAITFYNLTISDAAATATSTLGGTSLAIAVKNNLVVSQGVLDANKSVLTVSGTTTVNSGGELLFSSATGTKTLTGTVTINSGGTFLVAAAVTIAFGGDWTNSGTVQFTAAGVLNPLPGSLTNNGTWTGTSGAVTMNGSTKTISGSGAISFASLAATSVTNNGTLTVTGAITGTLFTNSSTGVLSLGATPTVATFNANAAGNSVTYTGGTMKLESTGHYYDVYISTGSVTATGTLAIDHNLTINSGTLTLSNTTAFTVTGTTTISGTLAISDSTTNKTFTGPVIVNSTGILNGNSSKVVIVYGINNSGSVSLTGTATVASVGTTFSGNSNIAITNLTATGTGTTLINNATLTVATLLTVTSPAILTNNGIVTATAALSGTGTFINAATGILNLAGTSGITTLTATATGNTVNYSALAGGLTVESIAYYNLTLLNTSGTDTAGGNATTTNLTVTSGGTFAMSTYALVVTSVTNNGIISTANVSAVPFSAGITWGGEVQYAANGGQTVVSGTYNKLTFATGGAKTMTAGTTINSDLTLSGSATSATVDNVSIGGKLNIGSGTTFTVAGFNFSVAGITSATGTLAHSSSTGTKTYTGAVSVNAGGSLTNAGNAAINFNGGLSSANTVNLGSGSTTVASNLNITGGTFTSSSATTTVTGNLTINGGTFAANGGVLAFAPAATSTISSTASTTFKSIYVAAPSDALVFSHYTGANLFTIGGIFTVQGSAGNIINIVSDSPTHQWLMNFTGPSSSVNYAYVLDSGSQTGSNNITSVNSSNGGNNGTCWIFATMITVSGTIYGTDASTTLSSFNGSVDLAVATSTLYTVNAASGIFTFSNVIQPATTTDLTIWLNTSGATSTSLVFRYGSSCAGGNCTGLTLIQNRVVIDNKDSGNMTIADMANCNNTSGSACSDTDIGFIATTTAATSTTLTFASNTLHIMPGVTFAPGGNVTAQSLYISSTGVYTGASETLTLTGTGTPLTAAGTFTANSNTVVLGTTTNVTIPALTYYNLTTAGTATVTPSSSLTVNNVLTIGSGSTFNAGNNTITLSATSTPFVVNTGGTFVASTSLVSYTATSGTTTPANVSYYNLDFSPSSGSPIYNLTGTGVISPAWYSGSGGTWNYRKAITINHNYVASSTGETYANFPLLVSLGSDANLAANASSTGADILFTTAAGVKLNHEIEKFATSTGELEAWVNVGASGLSTTTDTTLYMYYGNASAPNQQNATSTWDTNYKGVWHMPNGTTLSANDSTGISGGTVGGGAGGTPGEIGGAGSFNGSSQYIESNSVAFISTSVTNHSMSGWVYPTSTSGTRVIWQFGETNNTYYSTRLQIVNGVLQWTDDDVAVSSGLTVSPNVWTFVAFIRTGTNVRMFVNGSSASGTNTNNHSIGNLGVDNHTIGVGAANGALENYFAGNIDEVQVSAAARSTDWITTEYNNQSATSTFYSLGSQTSSTALSAGTTTVANNLTVNGGTVTGNNNVFVSGGGVTGNGVINMTAGTFEVRGIGNFGGSSAWTFNNLNIGNGASASTTSISTATTTINGVLTIGSTSAFNAGASIVVLTTTGTPFVVNTGGTFTSSSSLVSYQATSGTTTPANVSYYNLDFSPSSGSPIYNLTGTGVISPAWYSGSGGTWNYRKAITINHNYVASSTGETYANFPLLVSLGSDANLAANASSTGADILFTTAAGVKLNHEIEKFATSTGELEAWVNVGASGLSTTTDTTLYMYYGNASAPNQQNATSTWDTSYKAVWHLASSTTSTLTDSTTNGLTLHSSGGANAPTATGSGQIDGAVNFNNTSQYGTIYASSSTVTGVGTASTTMSMWVNFNRFDLGHSGDMLIIGTSTYPGYVKDFWAQMAPTSTNGTLGFILGTNNGNTYKYYYTPTIATSTWYFLTGTWGSNKGSFYVNGVLASSSPTTGTWVDEPICMGNSYPAPCSNGVSARATSEIIDETRLSNVVRSADWIKTEYNNQSATSTFYQLGSQIPINGLVTGTTTVANNLTVNGGTVSGVNNVIVSGGNVTGSGVINMTAGTFEVRGTGNFGGSSAWTFNNLNIGNGASASTTSISTATTTINGILAIGSSSTFNAGAGNYALTAATSTPFVVNTGGTFTASSSTLIFQGTAATTTIPNLTYYNLNFSPTSGSPIYQFPASSVAGSWSLATTTTSSGINSLAFDAADGAIYAGGFFHEIYRCATSCGTAGNWSVATSTAGNVDALAYDSTDGAMYAGDQSDHISRCASNCGTAANWTRVATTTGYVYSLAYDSTDGAMYAGDQSDHISRCASNCGTSGNWSVATTTGSTVPALAFDPADGAIYAGGADQIFRCTANCGTAGNWSVAATPLGEVYALGYDPADGAMYSADDNSDISRCAGTCSASGNWSVVNTTVGTPYAIAYNSTDGAIYVGDDASDIYSCTNSCGTAGNWSLATPSLNSIFSLAFDSADGAIYTGDGSGNIYMKSAPSPGSITVLNNFTIGDGTHAVTADAKTNGVAITVGGNLTIATSSIFSAASTSATTLTGNLTINGTFTANNGTLAFVSSSVVSTISGTSTTFYNLTSTAAGKTIQFQAKNGSNLPVFTVAGTMTLTGTVGNNINLQSDTPQTQWLVNFSQAQSTITYVSITDSGCAGGSASVTLDSSATNGGNNGTCWGFVVVAVSYYYGGGGGSWSAPIDNGQGITTLNTGGGNPSEGSGSASSTNPGGAVDGGDGGGSGSQGGGSSGGGGGAAP